MKIQNCTILGNHLDDDLAWRKVELVAMKKEVDTAKDSRQLALLRGSVTMLYAHWEGYIKNASTCYLCFVSGMGLRYGELSANFLGLAIKRHLDESSETRKARLFTKIADVFGSSLQQRARLPYDIVNTEGNLTIEVFTNILCLLGIPGEPYAVAQKPVIERLLYLRNNIAHGKAMRVEVGEYHRLHAEIITLLDAFRNDIETAVDTVSYKRKVLASAAAS